ncbi:hypothetical protein BMS3Abin02_02071 [bacterium BMS3Abin02]|nr:hypothetical protein BMS3Abin02_02071 [bacterium BMS3Abin02]GBE21004.1 hypothetical protein BMS3Bbin01_00345 [bacterium BMS3Bbin01]HDH25922.1 hypothetical protein [Actinomycetota bacterium]HDK45553.1 hypothetical protein [Actinomycetota bacterium]HDL50185.1 hypothetical protein [Actinomycetota bacterium]
MRWFWTDDLAAALTAHDHLGSERVARWIERPVAHAAADEATALEVARRLLEGSEQGSAREILRHCGGTISSTGSILTSGPVSRV